MFSNSTPSNTPHEIVGHITKGSSHMTARIIPSSPSHDCSGGGGNTQADRHSTESNDTGYISPGVQTTLGGVEMGEFQLEFKDTASTTSEEVDKVRFSMYTFR